MLPTLLTTIFSMEKTKQQKNPRNKLNEKPNPNQKLKMHSAANVCHLLDNILTLVVICQSHFFFQMQTKNLSTR